MRHHHHSATTRRRLTLVSGPSVVSSQATAPAQTPDDDRLVRGTVIEEPYLDLFGRACFTAVNQHGVKIAEATATPENREKVLARLWNAVDARPALELLDDGG